MSHHCFVLMIRAGDRGQRAEGRGQRSAPAGGGAVPTLPSAQPRPRGREGRAGSLRGQSGGRAWRRPCPGLPATCSLSVGSSDVGHSVSRDRGPRGQCQGAAKAPSWTGQHRSLLRPEPMREHESLPGQDPLRCPGSHPSTGKNPGAGSGRKEAGGGGGDAWQISQWPQCSQSLSHKGDPPEGVPGGGGEPPEGIPGVVSPQRVSRGGDPSEGVPGVGSPQRASWGW